jgi:uncharacterized protein YggE
MEGLFEGSTGEMLRKIVCFAVLILGLFLIVEAVSTLEGLRYIGAGLTATDTISVSGHGEVLAVPNIATFSFSVVADKAAVADAQTQAATVANAITAYLKSAGVADADIQTSGYSVSPQYEYQNAACPQPVPMQMPSAPGVSSGASSGVVVYCPPGKQVLTGYEVSQSTTVKVRDTSKAGSLLAGVGTKGATQISGLTFTIDQPDTVQAEARDKAIADAKAKADALAKSLGVSLVRVVSFNENGSGGVVPMVYNMAAGSSATPAASPTISTGQNNITDDVTIQYEIR